MEDKEESLPDNAQAKRPRLAGSPEPSTSAEHQPVVEASTSTSVLENAESTAAETGDISEADKEDGRQQNGTTSSSRKGKGKEQAFVPIHGEAWKHL